MHPVNIGYDVWIGLRTLQASEVQGYLTDGYFHRTKL